MKQPGYSVSLWVKQWHLEQPDPTRKDWKAQRHAFSFSFGAVLQKHLGRSLLRNAITLSQFLLPVPKSQHQPKVSSPGPNTSTVPSVSPRTNPSTNHVHSSGHHNCHFHRAAASPYPTPPRHKHTVNHSTRPTTPLKTPTPRRFKFPEDSFLNRQSKNKQTAKKKIDGIILL